MSTTVNSFFKKLRIAEGYMIDENGNDSGSLKENKDNNNRGMLTRSKSANQNAESIISTGSNRGGVGSKKGGIKPTRAQMLRNAQIEKVLFTTRSYFQIRTGGDFRVPPTE